MSKAFTKENDAGTAADDADLETDEGPALPQGTRNYITPEGAARLKSELKKLLNEDRPEVVRTVQWAASNGDRSENGDYIYGKRRLREIDRRIRFLTKRLESSEIVDPTTHAGVDRVLFGARVTVQGEEGPPRKYRIVGIDETDPKAGEVSWISPIAKALMGAKLGDTVLLRTPRGEEELEILEVRYE